MKRLFLFAAAVAFSIPALAQNSEYSKLMAEYLSINGSDMTTSMAENLKAVTPYALQLAGLSSDDPDALANKYASTQLVSDIAELFVPSLYKNDVSLEDLKEVVSICRRPEYQNANLHITEAVSNINAVSEQIGNKMFAAIAEIIDGKEPKGLIPSAPASYAAKIHEMYSNSPMKETMMPMLQQTFTREVSKYTTNQSYINNFSQYFSENFEVIMIDLCYGHVSEKDIEAYCALTHHPSYSKILGALKFLQQDPQSFGLQLVSAYSNWLRKEKAL